MVDNKWKIEDAVKKVRDQKSFFDELLINALGWEFDTRNLEDCFFDEDRKELGLTDDEVDKIKGIRQLRSMHSAQPWGIFFIELQSQRVPIVILRRVLRALIPKKRASARGAQRAVWNLEDLLFICTFDWKEYTFIHFTQPVEKGRVARITSFNWVPNEPMRTLCEFNLPPLVIPDDPSNPDLWRNQWLDAFNVEKVTREFFIVFADLYNKVTEVIALVRGLEDKAGRLAQLLLDRMLFLYFIQKKGWLNQEKDYLYKRFKSHYEKNPKGNSYYLEILLPLFESLSEADAFPVDSSIVPFLNGGLFEDSSKQSQIEQLARARLMVNNETFKEVFERLLEKYNFTVIENTPLDIEVAIDPEMLGKIFENLILQLEKNPEKDLRKLTGSYYTPRPIVYFMCKEALKEYIVSKLFTDNVAHEKQYRKKLESLMDMPVAYQISEEGESTLRQLFSKQEAKLIRQLVLDCRVCDPAVGSGAFLIGMLHEMIGVISKLDLILNGKKAIMARNYDYDLKKYIIENCLYGVDIQEQAVRLCELRLWLSLIVDYQIDDSLPFHKAIRQVPSLPNLSYKVIQGDSLLERLFGQIIQLDTIGQDAVTKQLIESIQADKTAYFLEGKTHEKRRLEIKILSKQAELAERLLEAKKEFRKTYQANIFGDSAMSEKDQKAKAEFYIESQILEELCRKARAVKKEVAALSSKRNIKNAEDINLVRKKYFQNVNSPTFFWRLDFAEVFSKKDGFDIIIGNPPYDVIDSQHEEKENLRKLYADSIYGRANLYGLFFHRSLQLLRKGGSLVFINPRTLLADSYFINLRRFLLWHSQFKQICNIVDRHNTFESVLQACIITHLSRVSSTDNYKVLLREVFRPADLFSAKTTTDMPIKTVVQDDKRGICLVVSRHPETYSLIRKMLNHRATMLDYKCEAKTGPIQWDLFKKYFVSNHCAGAVRLIWAENIQRYEFVVSASKRVGKEWLVLPKNDKRVPNITSPTVLCQRTTADEQERRIIAAIFDPNKQGTTGAFNENDTNYISIPDYQTALLVLGLINSKLYDYCFRCFNSNTHVSGGELNALPMPDAATWCKLRDKIPDLVSKIIRHCEGGKDTEALENELDSILYKVFDLAQEEIEVIENHYKS